MAASKAPPVEDQDAIDARALVQAAEQAVKAIESIRSRMVDNRDATAATGHVLAEIVAAGGALREYDRPHVWALRHALGAESHGFRSPHDAAAQVLATVIHARRPARDEDDARRQETARADMLSLAKILKASEHSIEATKNVEQFDAGAALSKAQADKAAHDARLAAGAPVMRASPPPPAAARAKATRTPGAAAPDGDYVLEGSADAPGGNPFPTTPPV
jgi:hypothetical protein